MLRISGTKILLTRGDSAYITLNITDLDGEPYEMQDGDVVRCQVRDQPNIGELLFNGTTEPQEDGSIIWYIRPEDTRDIRVGKYYWDAQLETSGGDIFTFITSSIFRLTDEVTMDD